MNKKYQIIKKLQDIIYENGAGHESTVSYKKIEEIANYVVNTSDNLHFFQLQDALKKYQEQTSEINKLKKHIDFLKRAWMNLNEWAIRLQKEVPPDILPKVIDEYKDGIAISECQHVYDNFDGITKCIYCGIWNTNDVITDNV